MQEAPYTFSPGQIARLDRLESRYPATRFEVVSQDEHSRALTVEVDDLETAMNITITASGRTVEA